MSTPLKCGLVKRHLKRDMTPETKFFFQVIILTISGIEMGMLAVDQD